ncbi:MAG: hypothetical protein N2235_06080 [Fischerella sp.]|nr:hypothetical protein [Fischerella sp.]
MLSLPKPKALVIRESKIVHKSPIIHTLARFVTEEAVCLMFNIKLEDIYVVECWRYIVYVHAKGVSKFVSYADFPPIVGVKPPTPAEMLKWRKRWRKQSNAVCRKQAPKWWAEFFADEFWQAFSESALRSWGELVELIKFAFNEETLQALQEELLSGLVSGWIVDSG